MSPIQYNNYVTLHRIWAHMHCIGDDSANSDDSINSVTPGHQAGHVITHRLLFTAPSFC